MLLTLMLVTEFFSFSTLLHTAAVLVGLALAALALVVAGALVVLLLLLQPAANDAATTHATVNPRHR
jgi:hypothetical protein